MTDEKEQVQEQELDLNLAASYANNAANALRAFEWATKSLLRAQAVQYELEIQEKALAELKAQVAAEDAKVKAQQAKLTALTKDERTRTTEIATKLSNMESEGLAKVKAKVDAATEELKKVEENLEAYKKQSAFEVAELAKATQVEREKLATAQKAYEAFIKKIAPGN